jgi:hypothetical protein
VIPIALGEKTALWFDLIVEGHPGHGALPPQQHAAVILSLSSRKSQDSERHVSTR